MSTTEAKTAPLFCDRPYQFEVIPQICLLKDVAHHLRMSERQLLYMLKRKDLALVELARIDRVRRFTGESVVREIKRLAQRKVA